MGAYEDIVALENEALAAIEAHRYDDALRSHIWALERAQDIERPRLMAVLFQRKGRVLGLAGRVQQSLIAYESGLRALAGDPNVHIEPVLEQVGDVGKEYHIRRAEVRVPDLYSPTAAADLAAAEASPTLALDLLIDIGNAYLRQPQEDPALHHYTLALQRPEIAEAPLQQAYAQANIAEIYRRQGKFDQAAQDLDTALRLLDAHAAPVEKRRALTVLAALAHDRKQLEDAEMTYHQALELYAEVDDPLGQGRAYVGLGRLYLDQRRYAEAEQAYQRALELTKRTDDDETLWHILWGLGCCEHAGGDLESAAKTLRLSLDVSARLQEDLGTDQGKVTFLDSMQQVFDELIAVHLDRARYDEALEVAEEARARALRDLMRYKERDDSRSMVSTASPSQVARAIPLSLSIRQSSKWVIRASQFQPLVRLVFHVLADRTAIFVVTPDGAVRGHVTDLGLEALAEQVTQIRQALGTNDPRGLRQGQLDEPEASSPPADPLALCRTLFAALIAPVMDALPTDGAPLVIEPHTSLWLLPFAALLGPGDRWLADLWPILYTPSAPVLDQIRSEQDYGNPTTLKALVVGNPVMPAVPTHDGLTISLEPLPGAEEEARIVAKMFDESRCTLLVGAHADRETVQTEAQTHGIVHLATHGVAYASDPLASFVALAIGADGNGLLTAREVIGLSLPADLVTLSACQTGLGLVSGEGMIGLSRAFLVAGARSVLVSLWSVSDQATILLMENFYRNYLASDNKAIALQRAMQAVRAMPEYQEPRYWAPFVVVGAEA